MAYLPLSTANLPDPVIDPAQGASPEDYFGTALYTGTGSPFSVSLGFQPDLVWQKCRSDTTNHEIVDSVRGYDKYLNSDTTNADATAGDRLASFDADGFSVSTSVAWNTSGRTYATWNWKANGSGVTNTDGSITSTVSANTTSGFSIITFDGDNTNGATIGHGLDSAPEFFVIKQRNGSTYNWLAYHASIGANKYLTFSGTAAAVTDTDMWSNTAPTNTTIKLSGATNKVITNPSSGEMLIYAFHSVEGFSKFGSYTGNGSTNGPFVYTGFRPAWVMIKRSSGTGWWTIFDTAREPTNDGSASVLAAQSSGAESTQLSSSNFDILSNGFKIGSDSNSADVNATGSTYIYMAFAENPFKYSNAR